MGNRAVITTREGKVGVYLHWNGGRDSVEAFLKYCKLRGHRPPEQDDYGWARLCQVIGNFFGGTNSIGIGVWDGIGQMLSAGSDNGVYVIEGWEIVDRVYPWRDFSEQDEYELRDMLLAIDDAQPERERIGGYLRAEEVPRSEVEVGDRVWVYDGIYGRYEEHAVMVVEDDCVWVDRYDHDGDWTWNTNNKVDSETVRMTV